jgi:hypothetical protein
MSDTEKPHEFLCNGKTWTVARSATAPSKQAGLRFRRGSEVRFLVFTRGALPNDRELRSMSEEVLCILLQRAVLQ